MERGAVFPDDLSQFDSRTFQDEAAQLQKVHIRLRQRKGRKTVTTVEGLDSAIDAKKLLATLKRRFSCNGVVVKDEEYGEVLQLQGDHLREFLIDESLATDTRIVIHGQ